MSDQAIIGLIVALGAGIAALIYFIVANIKELLGEAIREITKKLDEFVADLSEMREKIAEKSVILSYLETRLTQLEKDCRNCKKKG